MGQRWPHDVSHHPNILVSLLQQRPLQRTSENTPGLFTCFTMVTIAASTYTQGCVPVQQRLLSLTALQLPAPDPAGHHRLWPILLARVQGFRVSEFWIWNAALKPPGKIDRWQTILTGHNLDCTGLPAASVPDGQQWLRYRPQDTSGHIRQREAAQHQSWVVALGSLLQLRHVPAADSHAGMQLASLRV